MVDFEKIERDLKELDRWVTDHEALFAEIVEVTKQLAEITNRLG